MRRIEPRPRDSAYRSIMLFVVLFFLGTKVSAFCIAYLPFDALWDLQTLTCYPCHEFATNSCEYKYWLVIITHRPNYEQICKVGAPNRLQSDGRLDDEGRFVSHFQSRLVTWRARLPSVCEADNPFLDSRRRWTAQVNNLEYFLVGDNQSGIRSGWRIKSRSHMTPISPFSGTPLEKLSGLFSTINSLLKQ